MSKPGGRSWWSSMGFAHKASTPTHPDFADMGTAFGLDASMESLPTEAPAEPRAGDDTQVLQVAAREHRLR